MTADDKHDAAIVSLADLQLQYLLLAYRKLTQHV